MRANSGNHGGQRGRVVSRTRELDVYRFDVIHRLFAGETRRVNDGPDRLNSSSTPREMLSPPHRVDYNGSLVSLRGLL